MFGRLLKTKTFWGGLAAIATGAGLIVAGDVPNGIQVIILGVLGILGRDAIAKMPQP
jgi:hypothetical protein